MKDKLRIDWFAVVIVAVLIVGGVGAWAMASLLVRAVEVIAQ
jgi:tRNA A37 threonylcarbamoyladenosine dehydratase